MEEFAPLMLIIFGFGLMCIQHVQWEFRAQWMAKFQWTGSTLQEAYVPVEDSMGPELKVAVENLKHLN